MRALVVIVLISVGVAGCAKSDPSVYDAELNDYGQLDNYPGKVESSCPVQTASTLVIVPFGQSNTANTTSFVVANQDDRIVNYYDGRCYRASDPLLGTTGKSGNSFTRLGQKLMATGLYDHVVIVPMGVGGTPISRWVDSSDLFGMYRDRLTQLKSTYQVTDFLWDQGESDTYTDPVFYADSLKKVIAEGVGLFPAAKFYVATATGCQGVTSIGLGDAQMSLYGYLGVLAGPDTDTGVLLSDRYDGCHFSKSGVEKVSDLWLGLIQ